MARDFETLQVHLPEHQRPQDDEYYRRLNEHYTRSAGSNVDKLRAFPKFVPVAELGRSSGSGERDLFTPFRRLAGNSPSGCQAT